MHAVNNPVYIYGPLVSGYKSPLTDTELESHLVRDVMAFASTSMLYTYKYIVGIP